MIHYAARLDDLKAPPGNRLESLSGDLKGFHSIRINEQLRIVFRWTDAGPYQVRITVKFLRRQKAAVRILSLYRHRQTRCRGTADVLESGATGGPAGSGGLGGCAFLLMRPAADSTGISKRTQWYGKPRRLG